MPINKRDVDAMEANTILWDSGRGSVAGFGVRMQKKSKVFILKYRKSGRGRWFTIGKYGAPWTVETARAEAKRLTGVIATGGDPAAHRDAEKTALGPLLVCDLCDHYMAAAKSGQILTRFKRPKKASTLKIDEGRIKRHIKPLIGALPVAEVDRKTVRRMISDIAVGKTAIDERTTARGRAIVKGGATTAARVADLLSGIMAWAQDEEHITVNPVHGVRRYRAEPRQRFLSDDEITQLGKTLGKQADEGEPAYHPYTVTILQLLCLTGCRLGEIAALRWHEIDFQNGCLRLQDTKTGSSRRAVGSSVVDILKAQDRHAGSEFVFPASKGDGFYQGIKGQASTVFKDASIASATCHTLRHTFGTVASGLGYSDSTIGGLLGHAGRGVTSRYVHRPDAALQSAAEAVSDRIAFLMGIATRKKTDGP